MDIVCVGYIGHGMLPTGLNRSRYVALTGLNRSRYVAHGIGSDSAAGHHPSPYIGAAGRGIQWVAVTKHGINVG
jgi:hypothetical protein